MTALFAFFFGAFFAGLEGADFVLEAAGFLDFGLAAAFAFFAADECLGFEGKATGAGVLLTFGVTAVGAAGGAADCTGTLSTFGVTAVGTAGGADCAGVLSAFGITAVGAAGGADCTGAAIACCHPGVNISNLSRETELARRQCGQIAS